MTMHLWYKCIQQLYKHRFESLIILSCILRIVHHLVLYFHLFFTFEIILCFIKFVTNVHVNRKQKQCQKWISNLGSKEIEWWSG